MNPKRKRTREETRYWQELRRSSASAPHKNKAKYTRKAKHKDRAYV